MRSSAKFPHKPAVALTQTINITVAAPEEDKALIKCRRRIDPAANRKTPEFFARVGVSGTACRPVASAPHAFAYSFGHQGSGIDWGDVSDQCGAAGWYLSAEDMGRVLLSINARDGKILRETPRFPGDPVPSQFDQLRTMGLGLDINGPDWIEKNGGWSGCNENNECGSIATTAAIFGPGALPNPNVVGVLFINSNINDPLPGCQGNPCSSPRAVLRKAYDDALTPQ